MKLIIFVCNGNIYRSVIAQKVLEKLITEKDLSNQYQVDSFGLQGARGTAFPKHNTLMEYHEEWEAAAPILQEFGIDMSGHKFQLANEEIIKKASVVIAMDNKSLQELPNSLVNQFPKYIDKIHLFTELTEGHEQIADPFGITDRAIHEKVIKDIYNTLKDQVSQLLAWA